MAYLDYREHRGPKACKVSKGHRVKREIQGIPGHRAYREIKGHRDPREIAEIPGHRET